MKLSKSNDPGHEFKKLAWVKFDFFINFFI